MEVLDSHIIPEKPIKDNSKRAQIAVRVFWALCILDLIAVVSGYMEVELLEKYQKGFLYSEAEATANDVRQGIIGFLQFGLAITAIVVFLNWFRRAYGNLHRLNVPALEHSETMAVWAWFIPVINFWRPYHICREIFVETQRKIKDLRPDYETNYDSKFLIFWWVLFLVANYVSHFAFRSIMKENTIDDLIASSQIYMYSDLLDVINAIIVIYVIKRIAAREEDLRQAVE